MCDDVAGSSTLALITIHWDIAVAPCVATNFAHVQRIVNILTKTRGSKTFVRVELRVANKNCLFHSLLLFRWVQTWKSENFEKFVCKKKEEHHYIKTRFRVHKYKCKPTRYTHKMHYKLNIVKCRDLSLSPLYCYIKTVFPLAYRDKSMHMFLHVSSAFIRINKRHFSL